MMRRSASCCLTRKGRKSSRICGTEFEFVADYTARTYVQFFFNQSGEVQGNGRESGTLRPSDAEVTAEKVILGFKKTYLDKAAETDATNEVAMQAIIDHFDRVNATIRGIERLTDRVRTATA